MSYIFSPRLIFLYLSAVGIVGGGCASLLSNGSRSYSSVFLHFVETFGKSAVTVLIGFVDRIERGRLAFFIRVGEQLSERAQIRCLPTLKTASCGKAGGGSWGASGERKIHFRNLLSKLSDYQLLFAVIATIVLSLLPTAVRAQPDHLVITRMSNAETEYVEVFNPTGQVLTLESFEEESGADSNNVNRGVASGEYVLICEDGVTSVEGVSCDLNMSSSLADAGEGFRITTTTTAGGSDTDAVGDAAAASGFQEGGGISVSGDMHVVRDTDAEGYPVDTDDNSNDFSELVDLAEMGTPKTGYASASAQASVSIDQPIDGHDTDVSEIVVEGSASNVETGDTVDVSVNGTLQATVNVQPDSTWSATGIALEGLGDRVKAELDTNPVAPIADSDVVTVNFNDTNLLHVYNWNMEDEGPDGPDNSGAAGNQTVDKWYIENGNDDYFYDDGSASFDDGIESRRAGEAAMYIDLEAGNEGVFSETVPVKSDNTYEVGSYFHYQDPDGGDGPSDPEIYLGVQFVDGAGNATETVSSEINLSTSDWEEEKFSATAPSDAVEARMIIRVNEGAGSGQNLHVDDAEFVNTTTSSLQVNEPPDGYDTFATSMTVSGTAAFADAGDSVEVGLNGTDTQYGRVKSDADSSWSVGSFPISGHGNLVKVLLHEADISSLVTDSRVLAVNQQDTNLIFPFNWDMEDTGPEAAESVEHWYEKGTTGGILHGSDTVYACSYSLKIDDPTASWGGREVLSETVEVSVNHAYEVRGQFNVSENVSDKDIKLNIRWLDSSGGVVGDSEFITRVSSAGVWEQLSHSARAPGNAARARVLLDARYNNTDDNAIVNVDDMELVDQGLDKTVTITSPADGYDTSETSISVEGTSQFTDEADSVVVTLNGVVADTVAVQSDSSWTASVSPLVYGANTVVASLKEAGPTTSTAAQDTITVDNVVLPTLQLNEISPGGDGSAAATPNDWAEILVVDSGTIVNGWQLVEDEGATVGLNVIDTTVQAGETIVVHIESGTSDTTSKSGGSGPDHATDQWDVYGSGIDWTNNDDGAAMLREGGGGASVHDFVAWGDHKATGGEAVDTAVADDLDTALAAGKWSTIEAGVKRQYDLVRAWKDGAGAGERVVYADPAASVDSKAGWDAVAAPTLGGPNDLSQFQAGVGSGTGEVKPEAIVVGDTGQTLDFTYVPSTDFSRDTDSFGQVTIRVPEGWSRPSLSDPTAPGYITTVTTHGGSVESDSFIYSTGSDSVVVFTYNDFLNATENDTLQILYGDKSGGGPGAEVPNTARVDTFYLQTDPTGNNLNRLADVDQPSAIIVADPDTINLTPESDPGGSPGDTTRLTATVKDADGNALSGAEVSFSVTADPTGGGAPTYYDTAPADGTTDENGEIRVTFRTDSTAAGVNKLTAEASGFYDTFTQTTTLAGGGEASISPGRTVTESTDTYNIVYLAEYAITDGTVAVKIPVGRGWTPPTTTGGAGNIEVHVHDGTLGALTISGDTAVVDVASLETSGSVHFAYQQATAPGTTGTDEFRVSSAGGNEQLKPIESSSAVTVSDVRVVINEAVPDPDQSVDLNGDGTTTEPNDEFIEIYNFSSSDTDISGWAVDDARNTNDPDTFPPGTTLPSRGYVVAWGNNNFYVFDSSGDSVNSGTLEGSWSSLANSGDTVRLLATDGSVVREKWYDGSGANSVNEGRALARQLDNWTSYVRDGLDHYDAVPTPGRTVDTSAFPGPANGRVDFKLPATTVSTRQFSAVVRAVNANGDTVGDFSNSVDLAASPGIISPTVVNLHSGYKKTSLSINTGDSSVSTVAGTYAVTTTGTESMAVYHPQIDTSSLEVSDSVDNLSLEDLTNDTRLAEGKDHVVSLQIRHLDPGADTASLYFNRYGQQPGLGDTEVELNHQSGDTWLGTLTSGGDHSPGDSISFLIHVRISGGQKARADSGGVGFRYRVDPRVDAGPMTVTDGSSTLELVRLDGGGALADGTGHTIRTRILGADTAYLFDTATASGPEPTGHVATTADTKWAGSQVGADTWEFVIPDSDFAEGDTVNFILTARLISGGSLVADTVVEDSAGQGFAYEVAAPLNTVPSVQLNFPDSTAYVGGGAVGGTYVLTDPDNDNCTVYMEVSDDSGVTWDTEATLAGDVSSVLGDANGETYTFSWDALADLGNVYDTRIKLRMKAYDGTDTGGYDTSTAFTVDNRTPPRVDDLASTAGVTPDPDTGVFLTWTPANNDYQSFNIYRVRNSNDTSTAGVAFDSVAEGGETLTYHDASVTYGDSYFYYVTAVDTAGNESDSSTSTSAPHVSLNKTYDSSGLFRPGDTFLYEIEYVNDGFGPAREVVLEDRLPAGTYLSDTAGYTVNSGPEPSVYYLVNGSYQTTYDSSADSVRWEIGSSLDPQAFEQTAGIMYFEAEIK